LNPLETYRMFFAKILNRLPLQYFETVTLNLYF